MYCAALPPKFAIASLTISHALVITFFVISLPPLFYSLSVDNAIIAYIYLNVNSIYSIYLNVYCTKNRPERIRPLFVNQLFDVLFLQLLFQASCIVLVSISSRSLQISSMSSGIDSAAISSSFIIFIEELLHCSSPSFRYFLDRHDPVFNPPVVDLCHHNTSLINSASSTRASLCSLILVSQSL